MQRSKSYWLLCLILLIPVVSAQNWVADPVDCPSLDGSEFPGQDCTPEDICGDSSGTAQCYDTSTMSPPGGSTSTSSGSYGSFDGGYVINCYASADASAPFCDNSGNAWCDRMDSCYNVGRQTTCTGGAWNTATCSATCRTDGNDHFYCDGSSTDGDGCEHRVGDNCGASTGDLDPSETCYSASAGNCTNYITGNIDCDNDDSDNNINTCNGANGCEINPGSSCTVDSLPGTYASYCSGGAGVCLLDTQDIATTGSKVTWSSNATAPLLWLRDIGVGNVIHLNTSSGGIFHVNSTGAFWNDFDLSTDTGGGGGSDGTGGWTNTSTETNTSLNVNLNDGANLSLLDYQRIFFGDSQDVGLFYNPGTGKIEFNTATSTLFRGDIHLEGSGDDLRFRQSSNSYISSDSSNQLDFYGTTKLVFHSPNNTFEGNITADYFIGDGSLLTGISGGSGDGTGGWTNTSTETNTSLIVNILNNLFTNSGLFPLTDDGADLGSVANTWDELYVTDTYTNTITGFGTTLTVSENLISGSDSTFDLGLTGNRWRELFVDEITVTDNVTAQYYFGDGSQLTGISAGGGNASWNQTLADTLYAGIEWDYNQSDNLGNHIATQNLNMSEYNVTQVDNVQAEDVEIADYLVHEGDSDTSIQLLNDRMLFRVGNRQMFEIIESAASTDSVEIDADLVTVTEDLTVQDEWKDPVFSIYNGGYKQSVDGYIRQTGSMIPSASEGYTALCDGDIIGFGVTVDVGTAVAASTVTFYARTNGANTGVAQQFSSASTGVQTKYNTYTRGTYGFSRGDILNVYMDESDAGTSFNDHKGDIHVQYDC